MNTKIILLFASFSVLIAFFVSLSSNINYNLPFLIIKDEEMKSKIIELAGPNMANHFLTRIPKKQQLKIIEIWDLKNNIDEIVIPKNGKTCDSFIIKDTIKTFIYYKNESLCKVFCSNNYSRNTCANFYYFKNNKLCLYIVKLYKPILTEEYELKNYKPYQVENYFISNDSLIYTGLIPDYCTLGGAYEQINVKRAHSYLHLISNNKLNKIVTYSSDNSFASHK